MARKVILVLALMSMMVWLSACGRSRQAQSSDTPVPTLTPIPTVAATATQPTPTDEPPTVEPSPTVAATATPEATSTSVPSPTPEPSATEEIAAVEAITSTKDMTSTAMVSNSEVVTDSSEVTSTTVSEAAMPSSRTTPAPSRVAEITPPLSAATTPEATPVVEPTATATVAPTATPVPTETPTVTATATRPPTSTPSATATPVPTEPPTATPTLPPTATPAPTIAPTVATREREVIALPTDLATSVQITDVTLLTDLVERALPMTAELSPDGTQVAWLVPVQGRNLPNLCIAVLSGEEQTCRPVRGYQGMPYRLVWSPDGQWLAFSEDPAAQALESDMWLLNVVDGQVVNRSDDGVSGRHAEADGDFALDYLPMWDPSTGYLYFWRSTPKEQGIFDLDLMRLDPDSDGEAEVVRALEQSLGDGLVRFGWQRFYLQGPSEISPDGSQLAVVIAPTQEMDLSAGHALWLIDLFDPTAQPTQVANSLAWQTALPSWSNQPAVARGLQWTEDGQGLVLAALSSDLRLPLLLAYYVDVSSGDVTPVVDFSDSSERDSFFRVDPATGHAPRFHVPWTVALAPNANVLFLVTDLAGAVQILGASLPPMGEAPMPLYEYRSPGYEAWTRSSNGDGKTLVYGLVLESEPLQ